MMSLLRQWWWKVLCIPLLCYALIAGMRTPLGPGIVEVSPSSFSRGSTPSLDIVCYNTHFKEEDNSLNVILRNENNLICANEVTVVNESHLNVEYGLPPDLRTDGKKDFYNLIIYNGQDGTFFLRDAVSVGREDTVKGISMRCTTILKAEPPAGSVFPYREILYESIRNLFFHVPMWFTMICLMLFSCVCSIIYLAKAKEDFDLIASSAAGVGVFFGMLGLLTGMQWANFTWGAPWMNDPKLNGVALGMLVYLAYFVLRGSLNDRQKRARVSSVYSIFAFVIFIVFIKIVPDMTDSLHPGNGGNPAFKDYDLDHTMKPVFYAAAAGFILLGFWMMSLTVRYRHLLEIQREKTFSA